MMDAIGSVQLVYTGRLNHTCHMLVPGTLVYLFVCLCFCSFYSPLGKSVTQARFGSAGLYWSLEPYA